MIRQVAQLRRRRLAFQPHISGLNFGIAGPSLHGFPLKTRLSMLAQLAYHSIQKSKSHLFRFLGRCATLRLLCSNILCGSFSIRKNVKSFQFSVSSYAMIHQYRLSGNIKLHYTCLYAMFKSDCFSVDGWGGGAYTNCNTLIKYLLLT